MESRHWSNFMNSQLRYLQHLIYLLELINQKDKIDDKYYDKAANLQDFAVEIRYPNKIIELKDSDVEEAIASAKEFRIFILDKINVKIDYDEIIDEKLSR